MSDQRIALARYDSEVVEPSLRYDAWRDNMGVFFDVAPPDKSTPRITQRTLMEAADLGGMVLARARAESQVFCRDLRRLRRDGLGLILVQYFSKGGGVIAGGERLRPGDMQIVDSEQPYTLMASDYENLSLIVPYDQRDTISPVLETLHGRPISGNDPMVRLLGDHLQSLWRHLPEMTPAQASTALQGTLGLLRGWLGAGLQELDSAVSEALGASVRRYIEQNLTKPLRAEDLAQRFRVSRTIIYRLFKPYHGVVHYLWERRLQRAHSMLSSLLYRQRSIGAIAFACGFRSEAHFSRTFHARFGQTAREVRAEALDRVTRQRWKVVDANSYSTDVYWMIKNLASIDGVGSLD